MSHCQVRAKKKKWITEKKGVEVNFGCMACGVRIAIFSAAVLQHAVCSFTIYCREREGHGERGEAGDWLCEEGGGGGALWCRKLRNWHERSGVSENINSRGHTWSEAWVTVIFVRCTVMFSQHTQSNSWMPCVSSSWPLKNKQKKHQICKT